MSGKKRLVYFTSKADYESALASGNIQEDKVVFIQETKEIVTHGTVYKSVNWGVITERGTGNKGTGV